jgi:formylglycine-generating enzyme required for sulfatase activity
MKTGNRVFAAFVIAGFIVTGCSNGDDETGIAVTGVTLDKKEIIYLPVDEKETLTATVMPENAADKTVTWSSDKPLVATVSGGEVTGVADGVAVITVTTRNGRTDNCLVFVGSGIESVVLNKRKLILEKGKTETLTATVQPENALSKEVTWVSDNPAVATVSNGIITAVAIGTATITVTTAEGTKRAVCDVTVRGPLPPVPGMVWIESGTFMMGSLLTEPESRDNEVPHQVTLTQGFYMGKYEVTQGQYAEIMGYNPSYYEYGYSFYDVDDNWENYPVDSVTWYDAVEFCNKLSEREGLTPAYTINDRTPATGYPIKWAEVEIDWDSSGYRLPTEAEWEYACRAGTTTPFNFFNEETGEWGTDTLTSGLDGQANFAGDWLPYNGSPMGDYLEYSTPVGLYAPNAWGLYDMHGNVEEWCWDWYGSYRGTEMTDPKGAEYNPYDYYNHKVLRGGSFESTGDELRSAYRSNHDDPDIWIIYPDCIGFRVVRPYSEM